MELEKELNKRIRIIEKELVDVIDHDTRMKLVLKRELYLILLNLAPFFIKK